MDIRSRVLRLVIVIMVTLSFSGVAFAAAAADVNALSKLQRGAINTTTGWMEIVVQPVEGAQSDQPIVGAFLGFGEGILAGLQRTGYGLADSLSFPRAPYDRPVMRPETLFEAR